MTESGTENCALRFASCHEQNFLLCISHKLWGATNRSLEDWKPGDLIAFKVGKYVAALAEVSGHAFQASNGIWPDGVYPHRIAIRFIHAMLPEHRLPILGAIREAVIEAWGPKFGPSKYGLGYLMQEVVSPPSDAVIISAIKAQPNDLVEISSRIDELLAAARISSETSSSATADKEIQIPSETTPPRLAAAIAEAQRDVDEETSLHTKAQHLLKKLGRATHCAIWIAANDRSRTFQGESLGHDCLEQFPNVGLADEAKRRASVIDVIWIKSSVPLYAFEVEATTSIYSGLLRMSDLLALLPLSTSGYS